MAGPGGGPPRRSHTKSRKGCKTCKRRHIRCDENFPQCRNCTKHNCKCDYMEALSPGGDDPPASPQGPDLQWNSKIEEEIDRWRQTGVFPFPNLHLTRRLAPGQYSTIDLRLLHHLSSTTNDAMICGTSRLTLWTEKVPKFLGLAANKPYVMSALLGFSASHLAWLTESSATSSVALHYRGEAQKGYQAALSDESNQELDELLATATLLSWQSNDWRHWASLAQKTSTIAGAPHSQRNESEFPDLMDIQNTISNTIRLQTPVNSPSATDERNDQMNTLQHILAALKSVEGFVTNKGEEAASLQELMLFVRRTRAVLDSQNTSDCFNHLRQLCTWLLWLPVTLLSNGNLEASVLIVLAHLYAVTLALEPLFPDLALSVFGGLAVAPTESIMQTMQEIQNRKGSSASIETNLMSFPMQMILNFRIRRGWASGSVLPFEPINASLSPFESVTPLDFEPHAASDAFNVDDVSVNFGGSAQWVDTNAGPSGPFLTIPSADHSPRPPVQNYATNAGQYGLNNYSDYSTAGTFGYTEAGQYETMLASIPEGDPQFRDQRHQHYHRQG